MTNEVSAAAVPRVTRTQIVCGDCAGVALLPTRTFLTSNGDCANCGGRSYELASKLCGSLARHLMSEELLTSPRRDPKVFQLDQFNGLY